jgi:hypothetical protein
MTAVMHKFSRFDPQLLEPIRHETGKNRGLVGAHAAAIMPGFQRAIVVRHSSLRTRICNR